MNQMKINRFIIFLILVLPIKSFAQEVGRVSSGIDLGVGNKDKEWVPNAMYHQELSLKNFDWFRIGWGVRVGGYYGGRTDLAPKNTSLSGDTLQFGKITTNTISFLVGANFRLWKFDIGANTDLIGIAFGVKRRGLYQRGLGTSDGAGSEYYNNYVVSRPNALNALPAVLDNQNGQSELYVRFWPINRLGLKLGYVFGRVTYQTDVKLDNAQNKFSKTFGTPFVAVSFPLYN